MASLVTATPIKIKMPTEVRGPQKAYYEKVAFKSLRSTEQVWLALTLYSNRANDTKEKMFLCLKNCVGSGVNDEMLLRFNLKELLEKCSSFNEFCKQFDESMNFQPCVYKYGGHHWLDLPDIRIKYNESWSSIEQIVKKRSFLLFSKFLERLSQKDTKEKERKKLKPDERKKKREARKKMDPASFDFDLAGPQKDYYTKQAYYNGITLRKLGDVVDKLGEMSLHAILRADQRFSPEIFNQVKDKTFRELCKVFNDQAYKYGGSHGFVVVYYTQEASHPMVEPEHAGSHVVDFPGFQVIFSPDWKRMVTTFDKTRIMSYKKFMEKMKKQAQKKIDDNNCNNNNNNDQTCEKKGKSERPGKNVVLRNKSTKTRKSGKKHHLYSKREDY